MSDQTYGKPSTQTDRDFSDVKIMKKFTSIEENNNEIKILATNFESMGGLADKCIQNLESRKDKEMDEEGKFMFSTEDQSSKKDQEYNYDSDEFENDFNEDDDDDVNIAKNISTVAIVHSRGNRKNSFKTINPSNVTSEKLETNSVRSLKSPEKTFLPQNGKFLQRKMSNSTISLTGTMKSQSRRLNMSFTNDRAREIHRENHILMKKLMKTSSTNMSFPTNVPPPKESSSAIIRRRKQEKTNYENLILLRKIQGAKSSNLSIRR